MPLNLNSSLLAQLTEAPTNPIGSGLKSFLVTKEQSRREQALDLEREAALSQRMND